MMLTIIDNEDGKLFVYPEYGIVSHAFLRPVEGERFRRFLETGVEQFVKHNCNAWLSDDRLNSIISLSDVEWLRMFWEPKVFRAGWRFWAVVLPKRSIGKIHLNRHIKWVESKGIEVEVFEDPELALEWLKAKFDTFRIKTDM